MNDPDRSGIVRGKFEPAVKKRLRSKTRGRPANPAFGFKSERKIAAMLYM